MLLCFVAENANAPDDSRIRAKEARCENRTFRRDACQVSLKIPLMKSVRTIGSTVVERVHYLLPRPIITIAFLPNLNAQANVSENNPRIIYSALIFFFSLDMCIVFHVLCTLLYYYLNFLIFNSLTVYVYSSFFLFCCWFLSLNYSNR